MPDEIQIHKSTNHPTGFRVRPVISRIGGFLVMSALAILLLLVAYLSYVGQPSFGPSMKFEGFIELPKDNLINIFDYMAISDRTILVGNILSGSVVKVRLPDDSSGPLGVVSEQEGEGNAHGIAVVPNANKAFVTRSGKNVVDVFEVSSLRMTGRIPVSDDADAILYDSASGMIYVANGTLKLATVIDPVNLKAVATIPFGAELEFAAADVKHGLVYQNLHNTNEIAAVNLKTDSIVGRWPLTSCIGPSGLALDPSQEYLYAVCSGNSQMVVFSILEHRVIASVAVGGQAGLRRVGSRAPPHLFCWSTGCDDGH
ncbi:YncE family protein [Caballeronia sordidicola]|uniref:Collagen triple helix repeat domain protein n=1 Tax=Caballeronia sordidicola TaxID=196367 RepID=A0A242M5W6_CABSO|nr:YncE family protein [Caballeronia sordidicola]OTP66586.1 Collagen triple helix repeat domain protein [Caballeronia sordidicola]